MPIVNNKLKKYLLTLILVAATFLRFYQLPQNPPHLTPDEAALGYNAYSILKTGKDEYGVTLPIIFKSFGDYKPGLYIYSAIPFVAALGLNELSIRLPSAVAGIIAVWLVFKIIKEQENENLAYITSFLLALNPWHIYFSRGAWEINLALTLTLAGIYFFLTSFKRQKDLFLSAGFFALTLLTYQGAKLSTGIVVLILVFLYWKDVFKFKVKNLMAPLLIGFLISLPIILSFFSGKTGRLAVFSVFSYPRPKEYLQAFLDEGQEKIGSFGYYLFHSENYNFLRGILGRYFNHFSAKFLFFEGDWQNPRHSLPNHGMFLVADIFLFVFGLISLAKRGWSKLSLLIALWLLLAPLPSALSRDQVHAVRSYNLLIPMVVINSMGLIYLFNIIKSFNKSAFRNLVYIVMTGIYFFSFIYFLDAYFIHLPKHNAKYWMYGYKQVVEYVTSVQSNYSEVRVQQDYAQPYIYFLFFQKYDPAKYQNQARLTSSGVDVGQVEQIDNISFTQLHWTPKNGKALVVSDAAKELPNNAPLLKEIYYPDGQVAFRISETAEK